MRVIQRLALISLVSVCAVGLYGIVFGCSNALHGSAATDALRPLSSREHKWWEVTRLAVLTGDKSVIGDTTKMLESYLHPIPRVSARSSPPLTEKEELANDESAPHSGVALTALKALARLDATQALPLVEEAAQAKSNANVRIYAEVVRARLVAEEAAQAIDDPAQAARVRLERFLQELKLTAEAINARVAQLYGDETAKDLAPIIPVEAYALREIAAMLYRGPYSAYSTLPAVSALRFDADKQASLPAKLAPMSHLERIAWLVNDLAKQSVGDRDNEEALFAAAQGGEVVAAIEAKLKEMDAHREQYGRIIAGKTFYTGYDLLFTALLEHGDPAQAVLIAPYLKDINPALADYANEVYRKLKAKKAL